MDKRDHKLQAKKGQGQNVNRFKLLEYREYAKEKVNRHVPVSIFFITIILIYLIFFGYKYMSIRPTQAVLVESGALEEFGSFEAMVIRSEENVYAQEEGLMDVFLPAGATAKKGQAIATISSDLTRRNQILASLSMEKARLASTIDYDEQSLKKIQSFFRQYVVDLNYSDFDLTNQVELELQNILKNDFFGYNVQDSQNYQIISDNLDLYQEQMETIGQTYRVEKSSTIAYTYDGLEGVRIETFQPADLNRTPRPFNRLDNSAVKVNDFLFRQIDNLYYYFATKVDAMAYTYLDSYLGSYVTLFFPTKNLHLTVYLEKLERLDDNYLAVFKADRYINRFLEDRFIPFQISYKEYHGLKIPNSSIDTKVTWMVPKTAVDENEEMGYFVRKIQAGKKADRLGQAVRVKVYGEGNDHYYILPVDDEETLDQGALILNLNPETKEYEVFSISQDQKLSGVYVLNKGYTDFKRVEILYQSDNFSIVKKNHSYSIKIYDQIASQGHNTKEFSVVK